jgi:bifunctional non-homologous end joining protein LigD
MARRDGRGVRLFTRNGYNFADRFPKIVDAVSSPPVRCCFIDAEAIVVDQSGLSVFELLRYRHDLIELDGNDLRRTPIEERKASWRSF